MSIHKGATDNALIVGGRTEHLFGKPRVFVYSPPTVKAQSVARWWKRVCYLPSTYFTGTWTSAHLFQNNSEGPL